MKERACLGPLLGGVRSRSFALLGSLTRAASRKPGLEPEAAASLEQRLTLMRMRPAGGM